MRALLDTRAGRTITGIGRYTRTLRDVWRRGVHGVQGFTLGTSDDDLRLRATSAIEEALELPALLEREEIDAFHSPLFHAPPLLPEGLRLVITLHDAIPFVRPDLASDGFRRELEKLPEVLARADRVICPTEATRADLARCLGLDPAKLHVVPETVAHCFRSRAGLPRRASTADRPYVLVVGSIETRKDPRVVLDALCRPVARAFDAVFAGPATASVDLAAEVRARGLGERVRAVGVISDEDLVELYRGAFALVHPSHYEGFGLPIIEGFARGTPVIAARTSSLPEVAGDAALFFDPGDPDALAAAMEQLRDEPGLADAFRARGAARLRTRYSLEAVSEALAALYAGLSASSEVAP